MKSLQLRGLIAATFTPFYDDGAVNLSAIPAIVDFLVEQEIDGLCVLGSTGEGISLTMEERCTVAEAFVNATQRRIPVIVQVGSESTKMSRELAAHAGEIGADGISAVSPVYFKPDNARTLVETMSQIAGGAPQLPFYYYHIPGVTGVNVSALDFLKLASLQIPNLAGIKFTSPQLPDFQACVEFNQGQYEVLWGMDEMLLSGLMAGAQAAVGSTYNFAAPLYQNLLAAWQQGDLETANRLQSHSQQIVRTFLPYGPRSAQKAMFSMVGPHCGPSRLPVASLDLSAVQALRNELEAIDFFKWTTRPSVTAN